jgi:large subunit ribosomal protein L24
MRKIQKGDRVIVVTGDDRGKEGRVLKADPVSGKAIVEGVNFVKRHQRKTQKNPQGGIVEKEAPIHQSNLMVICGKCNEAVKTKTIILADGRKTRACRKCGEMIVESAQ